MRALFLDRDGVINHDGDHPHTPEEIFFNDGIFSLVKKFNMEGWLVLVVTNQAGVAKGLYDENTVIQLHKWFDKQFFKNGAKIDRWYYCPHHKDGQGEYRADCNCRKPNPGMLLQAQKDFSLSLEDCFFIGDKETDQGAAHAAGVRYMMYDGKGFDEDKIFKEASGGRK